MSLSRAFTTRRVKQSIQAADNADSMPHRSNTTRHNNSGSVSIRAKISAPVALVHTTNMLSYNAPDLFPTKNESSSTMTSSSAGLSSSSSSTKSDDDSDSLPATAASSPPTSPDSPFPEKRSVSPLPEPNHLSCYFTAPGQSSPMTEMTAAAAAPPPAIPKRSPSHTKKSYDALNRQRSISRLSEQSSRSTSTQSSTGSYGAFSRSSSTSTATRSTSHSSVHSQHMPKLSTSSFSAPMAAPSPASISVYSGSPAVAKREPSESSLSGMYHQHHPFGQELAQVSELAEEYSISATTERSQYPPVASPSSAVAQKSTAVMDAEDERILRERGLRKVSPEDYLGEIQSLLATFFADAHPRPVAAGPMWI